MIYNKAHAVAYALMWYRLRAVDAQRLNAYTESMSFSPTSQEEPQMLITAKDQADYEYMRQLDENDEDDFRFEITPVPEPEMGATHLVLIYSWRTGNLLETHITDNPYGMVEAAREAQVFSLEERLAMEFDREQRDREGGF